VAAAPVLPSATVQSIFPELGPAARRSRPQPARRGDPSPLGADPPRRRDRPLAARRR
jgi:hypothetical protein